MSLVALQAVFKDGVAGPDSIAPAAVQPIRTWIQGETTKVRVHVRRQSNGRPMDLTGYTAKMAIRQGGDGTSAPLFEVSGVGATLVLGILEFDFTTAQTKDLPTGTYLYDVWIQETAGSKNGNVIPASGLFLAKASMRQS